MFEIYHATIKNAVTDVSITVESEGFQYPGNTNEPHPNKPLIAVTVTFAVFTDSEAWTTIDGNGVISSAFGGTGQSHVEVDEYTQHAVDIWRAVTGDRETTCRYVNNPDQRRVFTPQETE